MTAGLSRKFAAFAYHGGAIDVARRLAPGAPEPWVDLSTGINPHPYPLPNLAPDVWTRLPAGEALAALEAAAGRRYGAPPEAVVAGPGSQALIHALARIAPRGEVGVLGQTYRGHADAFEAVGARVSEVVSLAALDRFKVAILVNPNNPDGRIERRDDLRDLLERLDRRDGLLIVDEAFADFDGSESLLPGLPAAGAVVLRSFGKTFGLPGLRLGFAIGTPDVCASLRPALGPWPVSGPAIAIGTRALDDLAWTQAMAAILKREAARLDALLTSAGWRVLGGALLFRLAARPDAAHAFERLLAAGILTRPLPNAPDALRFGIPGAEAEWERLAAALAACKGG